MRHRFMTAACVVLITLADFHMSTAQDVRRIPLRGTEEVGAVVVGDVPLIHTEQVFAPDAIGNGADATAAAQAKAVVSKLNALLADAKSKHLVKLNLYAVDQVAIDAAKEVIAEKFEPTNRPAVSCVISKLPVADALIAADAIATTDSTDASVVRHP